MWHPHSIKYSVRDGRYAYNDQLLANMDDNSEARSRGGGESCLKVQHPPRLVIKVFDPCLAASSKMCVI